MKNIILLIPLLCICCSTAEINVNNDAMNSVETIAFIPFTSPLPLQDEVFTEAENIFKHALSTLNYRIIEKEKKINAEDETGLLIKTADIVKVGKLTGADAVISGKITDHKEERRNIRVYRPFIFGGLNQGFLDDEFRTQIIYKFRITLTIIRVSDGAVILELNNRYTEAEHDEYLPGYISLAAYRKHTLEKTARELVQAIRKVKSG